MDKAFEEAVKAAKEEIPVRQLGAVKQCPKCHFWVPLSADSCPWDGFAFSERH